MNEHELNTPWILWFKDPSSKEWTMEKILTIRTIEDFWSFYKYWYHENDTLSYGYWVLMREGILPEWKDESNKSGGCWILITSKNMRANFDNDCFKDFFKSRSYPLYWRQWLSLSLGCIGEYIYGDKSDKVCGISITSKFKVMNTKIWVSDSSYAKLSNFSNDLEMKDQMKNFIFKPHECRN